VKNRRAGRIMAGAPGSVKRAGRRAPADASQPARLLSRRAAGE
jgi:hypothetical protein